MWKRFLLFVVLGSALGTLVAGPQKFRMGLHITANDKGELTSSLDSLDQNVLGIPVQQTTFTNNKHHLDVPPKAAKAILRSWNCPA